MELRPSRANIRRGIAVGSAVIAGAAIGSAVLRSENGDSRPANNRIPAAEAVVPDTAPAPAKPVESTSTTNDVSTTSTASESVPTSTTSEPTPDTTTTPTTSPGQFIYRPNDPNNYGGPDTPEQGPAWSPGDSISPPASTSTTTK